MNLVAYAFIAGAKICTSIPETFRAKEGVNDSDRIKF